MLSYPLRGHDCQGVQGGPHGLGCQLQPVQDAQSPQHVRGVRALCASRLQVPALLARLKKRFEQKVLRSILNQSTTKLGEHAEVEAGVAQFESQSVLPVYAGTDGLGSLPIRKPLGELHHRHQSQSPWRDRGTSAYVEEVGEVLIFVYGAEHSAHP